MPPFLLLREQLTPGPAVSAHTTALQHVCWLGMASSAARRWLARLARCPQLSTSHSHRDFSEGLPSCSGAPSEHLPGKRSQAPVWASGAAMPTFPTLTCTLQWGSVSTHSPVAKSDRRAGRADGGGPAGSWGSVSGS